MSRLLVGSFAALLCVGRSHTAAAQSAPPTPPSRSMTPAVSASQTPADTDRLVRELASADVFARRDAARDLAALGPAAEPASVALVRALEDPDDEVCVWAVRALAGIGPASASAVPSLLRMMRTRGDSPNEYCVLMPIGEIEKIGPAAVTPLVDALGTPDGENATVLLERFGEAALPALTKILAEGGARTAAAADVLESLGPRAAGAVPAVLQAWRARRLNAVQFLSIVGNVGPAARLAAADVITLLRSSDLDDAIHHRAVNAIRALGAGSEAVSALAQDARSADRSRRRVAAATIGQLGEDGRDGVSLLTAALEDSDLGIRNTAVEALGLIGPAACAAIDAITRARDRGAVDKGLAERALNAIQLQP